MRRLLVRPGAIGDCLCSLPALWLLQAEYTEIWTNGAVAPLIGFGSRACSLAGSGFSLLGLPAGAPSDLLERLRDFDEILSWAGFQQPEVERQAAKYKLPLHLFPALPAPDGGHHVSDWMIRQSQRWQTMPGWKNLDAEPDAWRLPGGRRFLLATATAPDTQRSRPLVVLHPFSGSARKNWPLTRFEQLACSLSADVDLKWCASPEDPLPQHLRSEALLHDDLPSLAKALQRASLYVGNDSGITHLAAMLGVPTVVLFGPMDPAMWAPRGTMLHVVRTPKVGDATGEIAFENVLRTVRIVLQRRIEGR